MKTLKNFKIVVVSLLSLTMWVSSALADNSKLVQMRTELILLEQKIDDVDLFKVLQKLSKGNIRDFQTFMMALTEGQRIGGNQDKYKRYSQIEFQINELIGSEYFSDDSLENLLLALKAEQNLKRNEFYALKKEKGIELDDEF